MLCKQYKLVAEPFDVTPAPRFLYPEVLTAIAVLTSLAERSVVSFEFAAQTGTP
jgi:hypothetical protein